MSDTYNVLLLVEQALTAADAAQVHSLHEGLDYPVHYHVLLPVDDAAARVEAAMGAVGGDTLTSPSVVVNPDDVEAVRQSYEKKTTSELAATLEALQAAGATADGELVQGEPIHALRDAVARLDGREAIILTRPHVVSEFFHIDWTSRARRKIGVPVLHLLEHETFDDQAGAGEGVSGA